MGAHIRAESLGLTACTAAPHPPSSILCDVICSAPMISSKGNRFPNDLIFQQDVGGPVWVHSSLRFQEEMHLHLYNVLLYRNSDAKYSGNCDLSSGVRVLRCGCGGA